jgi:hypothetical protein
VILKEEKIGNTSNKTEWCAMNILELFAGSRSFGKIAEKYGHNVLSVDYEHFDKINIVKDIEFLSPSDIPFIPDVVWASPDCTTYSISAISHHRKGVRPISEYAMKCDRVNQHFLNLIAQWREQNPSLLFWIENPRGMLRKMAWMRKFHRYTVWYCQYGDVRAKPTDIWTNSGNWKPRKECFNNNRFCHHELAPRGSKTGTQGLKDSYNRSKIPEDLVVEIIESFTKEKPMIQTDIKREPLFESLA